MKNIDMTFSLRFFIIKVIKGTRMCDIFHVGRTRLIMTINVRGFLFIYLLPFFPISNTMLDFPRISYGKTSTASKLIAWQICDCASDILTKLYNKAQNSVLIKFDYLIT